MLPLSTLHQNCKKCNKTIYLFSQVFLAWADYTVTRRNKAKRISEAMEMRRMDLLKQGLRQWLAVAGELQNTRKKVAMNHQAQVKQGFRNAIKAMQTILRGIIPVVSMNCWLELLTT